MYLIAVCVKTFLFNKNGKVLIKNPVFYKMFTKIEKFKNFFYDEKTRKLAIDVITFSSRSRDDRFWTRPIANAVLQRQTAAVSLEKPKFCWSTLNWCCLATRTRCCCGAVRWLSARCSQGLVRVCAFRYGGFEISDGKTLWEGEDQEIVFVRSACFVEVRFVGSVKLVSEFVYAFVFKVF